MSETSENLINSETNENVDIPKKPKEVEKSQELIDEEKETEEVKGLEEEQANETKDNGLEETQVNELQIEKTNGVEEDKKHDWEDLLGSGSLMKKIIREGEPDARPMRLEKCVINYECRLEDGTLVEEQENFEMLLGDCEVIQGLDVALGLMNQGEKCELKIQSRLAYGPKGLKPNIPPDATVLYTVELVSVEPEEEIELLTVEERQVRGNKKRERGNWWYGRGENNLAVQCYRRALDYLDEVEGGIKDIKPDGQENVTDATLQSLLEDRLSVSNNMAAAQIKLGHYDAALNLLQTVLRCQPDNIKALYRKAKIHREKNDLNAALKCLQKANSVSANNPEIQKELASLNNIMQKQKVTERELARRMFSGPKSAADGNQSETKNKKKLFFWTTVVTSVAVAMAGIFTYRMKFA